MSRNDLNSAIGRTKKWDYIGVDPKERKSIYTWVNYKQSCRKLKPKNDMEEGFVYKWVKIKTCELKSFEESKTCEQPFYIGPTSKTLEERETEHRA